MKPPSFSVVICAYTEKRWDDLCAAVASVRSQTLLPRQVVVVVDHNPVLLARAQAAFTGATVVPNQGQRGLSGARNSGVAVAQGDVVAFLDDDAFAEPDWLGELAVGYDTDDIVGVGGGVEPCWPAVGPGWLPEEFRWVVGCSYLGQPLVDTPVRNFIGANMSFRRSLFDSVGGFRSDIGRVGTRPLGCEETELCIRVSHRLPGSVLLYRPGARVHHRVGAERMTWAYFRSRCYAEGLSKAMVARVAGRSPALSAERAYVIATLPRGIARGLRDGVGGDPTGLPRALAMAAGLATTSAGYLAGTFVTDTPRRGHPSRRRFRSFDRRPPGARS